MLGWLKVLPDSLIRVRPVFSVAYAIALLNTGLPSVKDCGAVMEHTHDKTLLESFAGCWSRAVLSTLRYAT